MTHGKSVVVPVEPTREMLNAAVDATDAGSGMSWSNRSPQSLFDVAYRAMLAAAPAPSSLAGGEDIDALDQELIDRGLRTVRAYDAVRFLRDALSATTARLTGYDWNADPEGLTKKQGDAFALADKVFTDLSAAVDAHPDIELPECQTCGGTGKIEEAARTEGANQHSACVRTCDDCDGCGFAPDEEPAILDALSPEAPAREGVEPWKEGREEGRLAARPWRKGDPVPAVGTMVLVSGAHGDIESDQHRAFQWRRVIGYGVDGADFICLQNKGCWPTVERMENCWFAALTPRHEAPAEPCASHRSMGIHIDPCCPHCEAPAEGAGEAMAEREVRQWIDACNHEPARQVLRDYLALRARSSAPEAREEALGNLLAVIHGDGGHRALEVGVEQAAAEAEKIVAGLFAAPSADKLREEVTRDQIMGVVRQYAAPAWCSVDRMADALLAIMSPAATPDALKGDAK